jgi:hypothetical protein
MGRSRHTVGKRSGDPLDISRGVTNSVPPIAAVQPAQLASPLHLTWPGKSQHPHPVPGRLCILNREHALHYGPAISEALSGVHRPATAVEDSGRTQPMGPNMLIQGDNLSALALLRENLAEHFELIYADPPFSTTPGSISKHAPLGASAEGRREPPSETSPPALRYSLYLHALHPRLLLTHGLLRPGGTFVFHAGHHIVHYVRLLLDEVFGMQNFAGEVLWCRWDASRSRQRCLLWDSLLIYRKADVGKRHTRRCAASGPPWPCGIWRDIASNSDPYSSSASSRKPEQLLERVILLTTNEGDLVGDFFCGSGTTLVAAAKSRRAWVGCDVSALAIGEAERRITSLPERCEFHRYLFTPEDAAICGQ